MLNKVAYKMKVDWLLKLVIVSLFLQRGNSWESPQLIVRNSSGFTLDSPTNQVIGELITFTCIPSQIAISEAERVFSFEFRSQNSSGAWETEIKCTYVEDGEPITYVISRKNNLELDTSSLECPINKEYAKLTFPLPMSSRDKFDCKIEDVSINKASSSAVFNLNFHSRPKTPLFRPNFLAFHEGESATISCFSSGIPVPQLNVQYDGEVMNTSNTTSVKNLSSQMQSSSVEWTIPIVMSSFDAKEVTCRVVLHPYNEVVESTRMIHVIYGPPEDPGRDIEVVHNRRLGCIVTLNGTMAGFPPLSYSWYPKDSLDSIGSGAYLEIDAEALSDSSTEYKYTVVVRNPETGRIANKTFTLILDDDTQSEIIVGGIQKGMGLQPWAIAVIVIGIAAVAALAIGATIFVKRNHKTKSSKSKRPRNKNKKESPMK